MNKKTVVIALAIFIAGGLGTAVGTATASTPAKTITNTVQGPERIIETTVEKTPQVCLDALDAADAGFTVMGQGLAAAGAALHAVSTLDLAGITKANEDLTKANEDLDVETYMSAREACRAS